MPSPKEDIAGDVPVTTESIGEDWAPVLTSFRIAGYLLLAVAMGVVLTRIATDDGTRGFDQHLRDRAFLTYTLVVVDAAMAWVVAVVWPIAWLRRQRAAAAVATGAAIAALVGSTLLDCATVDWVHEFRWSMAFVTHATITTFAAVAVAFVALIIELVGANRERKATAPSWAVGLVALGGIALIAAPVLWTLVPGAGLLHALARLAIAVGFCLGLPGLTSAAAPFAPTAVALRKLGNALGVMFLLFVVVTCVQRVVSGNAWGSEDLGYETPWRLIIPTAALGLTWGLSRLIGRPTFEA